MLKYQLTFKFSTTSLTAPKIASMISQISLYIIVIEIEI